MEQQKIMSHYIKGVLISLLVILLGIIGYFAGLAYQPWYSWTVNGILFIAIIIGCVHYANQKDNYVTFGNIFSYGFKMTAIIALIMVAYTLLSMGIIFPEIKEKTIELTRERMEEQGKMSDSQIDTALETMSRFFLVGAILGAMIGTLIFGLVASLIGAGVAKKKPVNPMDQLSI